MNPRVSVVIPAWNSADYLAETIESVLAQTFDDVELVIADHQSTDDTPAVIERYRDDPRVRVLDPTPAGGGAKANWNRVSQAATGELLKLLPGDDVLHPTCLERQVAAFDEHPTASLVCCRRRLVDANGRTVIASLGAPSRLTGLVSGGRLVHATVTAGRNLFGEPGAVLLRRELLEAAGWWDDQNPYLIDMQTCAWVLVAGRDAGYPDAVVQAETLADFRLNSGQWSVRLTRQQSAQAAGFHAEAHRRLPATVRRRDVVVGNTMARVAALTRQATYVVLGSRMRRSS